MNGKDQKTILLVEDEAIVAAAEKIALEKYGYNVITALTGEEAVALVEKTPAIDLVLMDINLGAGMDGTEAAAIILKDHDLPIVFLSSHMEPEVVARTEKITSYGYVVKNSSITVLDTSIKMAFKLHEAKIREMEKETALRESEERYQAILEQAADAIFIHDESGRIIEVNRKACQSLGYSKEELLSLSVADIDPEAVRIEKHKIWGEILAGRQELFESRHQCKDGSTIPVEVTLAPVRLPARLAIIAIVRDISKRKRTEITLRESEERLKKTQEIAHLGSWELDIPSGRLLWSDEVYRIFGLQPQEFGATYEAFLDMIHPQDRAAVASAYSDSIEEDRDRYEIEHRIIRRHSGEVRHVQEKCEHFRDASGKIVRSLGMVQDITKSKGTEESLKNTMRFQQALMDAVPSPIFYKDADCVYIGGNKAFEQYIGLSRQQFIGKTVYDISPRDLAERYDRADRELLRNGGAQTYEASVVYADGTRHDVIFNKAVFTDSEGHAAGLIGVMLDISMRKRAEAQREAALEALHQSEERFHSLFDNMAEGVALHELVFENGEPVNYRIMDINDRFLKIIGIAREQVIGKLATEAYSMPEPPYLKAYAAVATDKKPVYFETFFPVMEKHFAISVAPWQENGFATIFNDISERKQEEAYAEMGRQVLQILNKPGTLRDSIQHVLAILKARTGFDAVGMRLRDGDDFPYFVQEGFSRDFLLTENTLIERGGDGGVCRDDKGNISLECTCGLVISGKADLSAPLFTGGGSFWTNDSLPLLELGPDQDPRHNPRNQCIHQGYASVALVPIRMKEEIVGLLQFNDRRKERFSLAAIEQLENIAAHVGEALMRKQAEAEIQRQLTEKEILLKEVQHRIKNNIASIGGLISLHMQKIDNPEAIAVLQEAIGRIDSMRVLYDTLLLSEGHQDIPMKNYLESLAATVVSLFPDQAKVKLDLRVDDFNLDAQRLFPLGLIINELLTNTMKYAFVNRKTGLIKIAFSRVEKHVTLTVQDNGKGLPAGFDIEQSKGFGLMLVKMLVQQLGGNFAMEGAKGTRCTVEFDI